MPQEYGVTAQDKVEIGLKIASAMLSDLSPEFYQVCLRSTGSGQGPFRALPICGRWGWRRRARLAGLL